MTSAPLSGVRVVEFGHYIAAPAATQILGDLGAEVVKVEPPKGDQARSIGAYGEGIVCAYNRGKQSVALDLKDSAHQAIATDLVATADVVVQNLRAGVMDRLGMGAEELTTRHPHLVHVSVSGFGATGASAQRPGLDIAAQAESGMMSVTGERDGDPQRVGFPISDVGASYAVVQAVLLALFRRERTGLGGTAEVSLVDVSIHMLSALWGEWHTSGVEPRRKGNGQGTVAPAADLIGTSDGTIVLSAYTPEHFARLCQVLDKTWLIEDPRFQDNAARVAHRQDLLAEIGAVLGRLTTKECVTALVRRGIVAAEVSDFSGVAQAPDIQASGILTTGLDCDGQSFAIPSLPFRLNELEPRADQQVPHIGQDGDVRTG